MFFGGGLKVGTSIFFGEEVNVGRGAGFNGKGGLGGCDKDWKKALNIRVVA